MLQPANQLSPKSQNLKQRSIVLDFNLRFDLYVTFFLSAMDILNVMNSREICNLAAMFLLPDECIRYV